MNRMTIGALALVLGAIPAAAQSLEDLNIQIHGYATQGFLYSTQNNLFTTQSSNGSPAWDEAVMNVSAQPIPKLRVGVQARYFMLGNYGNNITLDWAMADYKFDDRFGIRAGKTKTPSGLFNEIQDIDPSYTFALLPQGVYSIASRNSLLSQYGGVVYGTLKLNQLGKLEYRGWGGERAITADDGNFLPAKEAGTTLPYGLDGTTIGAALHWRTPIDGLMIGASDNHNAKKSAPIVNTPTTGASQTATNGTQTVPAYSQVFLFSKYERNKVLVAGEFEKADPTQIAALTGKPVSTARTDTYSWYTMVTYKLTGKLTAGSYYLQEFNRAAALGPKRYLKELTISGRYDFNQFLYAKFEEHLMNGNVVDYDTNANPGGLQRTTKLTLLKFGVSF
jgi:hypothetical protein